MKHLPVICLFTLAVLSVVLSAPSTKQADGGMGMGEDRHTARSLLGEAQKCDMAGQMRRAELCYRKAYETLEDNPSKDWIAYGEAGYRYACMRYQRGDTEGVLVVINEILDKAEGQKDFPSADRTGLLSLMAQCQLHLAMPEAARQTFAKAYENELAILGGEERGDFNLAFMCSNIFSSFYETGEYEEAGKWLDRFEREILACEKLGTGDSVLLEEQKGSLALYKAKYLQATGRAEEAAAVYAAIPNSCISMPGNILDAIGYLMAAGRYEEAAWWYGRLDTILLPDAGSKMTFDNIAAYLSPCYIAYRRAGLDAEALVMADSINAAIGSALVHQKQSDAAELAVIYQTHEKDLRIKDLQFTISFHRMLFIAGGIILLLIAYMLYRAHIYNNLLAAKNRSLYEQIQQREQAEAEQRKELLERPAETLSQNQRLYIRLCELMKDADVYSNAETNHETLARLLGTNRTYLSEALRECAGTTPADFINQYRIRHAAHLLTTTDDPICVVGELSGIPSRATLARLFRGAYGMSCSEYRQAARAEAKPAEVSTKQ